MPDPQASRELPKYKCHKEVRALKIAAIYYPGLDGSVVLSFAEPGYEPKPVDSDWVYKHAPKVGGYLVVYDDGYLSFSPRAAFEEGYTRIDTAGIEG